MRRLGVTSLLLAATLVQGCVNPFSCDEDRYDEQRWIDAPDGSVTVMVGDTTTAVVGYYPGRTRGDNYCGPTDEASATSRTQPTRFQWVSSDPSVVAVEHGFLRAISVGDATVTVTTSGAPPVTARVFVVRRVTGAVVRPTAVTARIGDPVIFDAYLVDDTGQPHDTRSQAPYPLNLQAADSAQAVHVINYLQPGPHQLRKSFDRAGTYRLDLVHVVRNVGPFEDVTTVTVIP